MKRLILATAAMAALGSVASATEPQLIDMTSVGHWAIASTANCFVVPEKTYTVPLQHSAWT